MDAPPPSPYTAIARGVAWAGCVALFLFSAAFGVLEVHSSTDTWIGLAAGREILTSSEFPKADTFSFTFNGATWYNQNWLTHVYLYWLYSHLGPNWVIYGTWALSASVFLMSLLACYWRSGTWFGATVAAAMVAVGCRDFLSARPATTGFFFISALWCLLCAIEGQRGKTRWWPVVLLLPLLILWGNAHGSFVFAYGVVGMYVAHWFVASADAPDFERFAPPLARCLGYLRKNLLFWIPRSSATVGQALGLLIVLAVAALGTLLISPFGVENFTHVTKIAGSEVFRQVSEWIAPHKNVLRSFPPMVRFWWILGVTVVGLLGAWVLSVVFWAFATASGQKQDAQRVRLSTTLFDVGAIGLALYMTLSARRFAPIFYLFSAPVLLTWITLLFAPVRATANRRLRLLETIAASALPALVVGCVWLWVESPSGWLGTLAVKLVGSLFAICALGGFVAWARWKLYGALRVMLYSTVVVAAAAMGYQTTERAYKELVERPRRVGRADMNLLDRVTRYDDTPHEAMLFIANNELHLNLVAEWTQGGIVMFHAPTAKVFMDGRAQQVYDEAHYLRYQKLMMIQASQQQFDAQVREMNQILDQFGADAVLIRGVGRPIYRALSRSREWVLALYSRAFSLFVRIDSPGLTELRDRLERGAEWRPDTPEALAARGVIWLATEPLAPQRALDCWTEAVRRDISQGALWWQRAVRLLYDTQGIDAARQFVRQERERLNRDRSLPLAQRQRLAQALERSWKWLLAKEQGQPDAEEPAVTPDEPVEDERP